jgi:phosphatidylethanolamine-binding protein
MPLNQLVKVLNAYNSTDTQTIPHLKFTSLNHDAGNTYPFQKSTSSHHYIVFMIDLDVPQNDTTVPFLHWYQPDLSLDHKTGKLSIPKSSHLNKAEYYPPSPPPGPEHRYVEVLFVQPSHYKLPSEFERYMDKESSARVGFDIREFVKAAELKKPVAGNWFLVQEVDDENEEL